MLPFKIVLRSAGRTSKRLTGNMGNALRRFSQKEKLSPLAGVRVLDLTRILAGPHTSMILGDLGAEIIKLERPGSGDDTRLWVPPVLGTESCYFFSVNRNKKSVAVDFKHPRGQDLVRRLALESDILLENFVPDTLARASLDYESLRHDAPRLIYCSINGFGSDGPYKHRAGYDVIAASIGGLIGITGPENGAPCKVGVAMTDLATGLYAYGAVLAALIQREKTGMGQKIECNLLSTQVACLANIASNYLNAGLEASRWGTAHESIVPYQAFATQDGYLTVGAGSNAQFSSLCRIIKAEWLLKDERFASNSLRVQHRVALLEIVTKIFSKKSTKGWLTVMEGAPFPYGPINSISQVFGDPQVLHHKMVQEVEHPTAGKVRLVAPPVKFSLSENRIRSPPPQLGQHTVEVLKDVLGLSQEDIFVLSKEGIIQSC